MASILITGAAGFIGYHLAQALLNERYQVIGIDNLNSYYDVTLKESRLAQLTDQDNFTFHKLDLVDRQGMEELFSSYTFEIVIHVAAQAGVRYSLTNPQVYIDSNIVGFSNILECCRHHQPRHLVYASSSSVYGANRKIPFSTQDSVDRPISLYAATKKANELMAYTYSHLYGIPTTGLRFFTVYGPWGRPDMAPMLFAKAILAGQPIDVFNYGKMQRDFTYIDDIVRGIIQVMDKIPKPKPDLQDQTTDTVISNAPYRIYNIGNNQPVELLYFIEVLEKCLGMKTEKNLLPIQPGDVPVTYADIDDLVRDVGFKPDTPIEVGVEQFVTWYRSYYQV